MVKSNGSRKQVGLVMFGGRQPGEGLMQEHSKYELGTFQWMEGRPA